MVYGRIKEILCFQLFHISSTEAVDFLDKFLAMNPDPRYYYHILVCCITRQTSFAKVQWETSVKLIFIFGGKQLIVN